MRLVAAVTLERRGSCDSNPTATSLTRRPGLSGRDTVSPHFLPRHRTTGAPPGRALGTLGPRGPGAAGREGRTGATGWDNGSLVPKGLKSNLLDHS